MTENSDLITIKKHEKSTKTLSVVVIGRNDNYMGNFKYRFSTCLNFIAWNLESLDCLDEVEFIIVDWNSEIPLAKDLPLSSAAAQISSFIHVPPAIATQHLLPQQVFHSTIPVNIGVRRANGKFIMSLSGDTLIPRQSIRNLLDLLNNRIEIPVNLESTLFLSQWYRIPISIVAQEPTLKEWNRYLFMNARRLIDDSGPSGLGIGSSCLLMHRTIWHGCRGYDERYSYWGWSDADITLRISQKYPWVEMAAMGVSMFEMDHSRGQGGGLVNLPYLNSKFTINDSDWGLGTYGLEIHSSENIITFESLNPSYSEVGKLSAWNQSAAEILEEITSAPVCHLVQWLIESFDLDIEEWNCMYLLAWYSLHHSPRSYLELDLRQSFLPLLLATARSDVEIYGVIDLSNQPEPTVFFGEEIPVQVDGWQSGFIPYETKFLLKYRVQKYMGYTRYIVGPPNTAIERLSTSCVGPFLLDIALIRTDNPQIDVVNQVNTVLPCVRSNGMILIVGSSLEDFIEPWDTLKSTLPQMTFIQVRDFPTGAILLANLKDKQSQLQLDLSAAFSQIKSANIPELREISLIAFVDWEQPESDLCEELTQVILRVLDHPHAQKITLLLDANGIDSESADLLISSILMDLMLEVDLAEELMPEVLLLNALSDQEWRTLLPQLTAYIPLTRQNQGVFDMIKIRDLPVWDMIYT
jgi:hypothetical protein